jgi:hypothetical protein
MIFLVLMGLCRFDIWISFDVLDSRTDSCDLDDQADADMARKKSGSDSQVERAGRRRASDEEHTGVRSEYSNTDPVAVSSAHRATRITMRSIAQTRAEWESKQSYRGLAVTVENRSTGA